MNWSMLNAPEQVVLRELGLRDGLQLTRSYPDTPTKLEWIYTAYAAGVRNIEVGSFLPVKNFPQFADIRSLITAVSVLDDACASALTLNEQAIDDALTTEVGEIVISISATEEHCQANIRRSQSAAVELIRYAVRAREASSRSPLITVAISVAFGCSIAGDVDPSEVIRLSVVCAGAGADRIAVADTVGYAGPRQVFEMCKSLLPILDSVPLVIHLHDTRGTGIANAYAALEAGVRILDGTIAGLGGCPFAPGATGNVVFEDLVYLCERCGFATGIDLELLMNVRPILEKSLGEETLNGALAQAGVPGINWRTN